MFDIVRILSCWEILDIFPSSTISAISLTQKSRSLRTHSIRNLVLLENRSSTFNSSVQAFSFVENLSFKHSLVNTLLDVKLLNKINQVKNNKILKINLKIIIRAIIKYTLAIKYLFVSF